MSGENNTHNSDDDEYLSEDFYKKEHIISNIEYSKSKLSNFAIKILNNEPIIALFDTGATCSCILHHLFQKISDKVNMKRCPYK